MGKGKAIIATASFVIGGLLLGACSPSQETPGDTTDTGNPSALTVAWNQGFDSLNHQTEVGNAVANSNIVYMVMDTFAAYDKELNMTPYPDYGTVEQISEDPLTLRFTLSDKAMWSDGTPVTAIDTVLAWAAQSNRFNTITEPKKDNDDKVVTQDAGVVYFSAAGTTGFELIEEFEVSDDLKSVTFTFGKPYIDWFEISPDFGRGLPAHIVAKRALGITD
ncbi:MAG: ABC transporter substrate-binding protein, partial [Propionibacteriaceae bacterium]|nr:ABC transporter substrate-binding protein [Propionibacteriaceae bacterium]